jgi:hypothetical protein
MPASGGQAGVTPAGGDRASQEVFVELTLAVLHQCIRFLIGAVLLRTIMDISARAF